MLGLWHLNLYCKSAWSRGIKNVIAIDYQPNSGPWENDLTSLSVSSSRVIVTYLTDLLQKSDKIQQDNIKWHIKT